MKYNNKILFLIFTILSSLLQQLGCNVNLDDIGIKTRKGGVTSSGEIEILKSKLSAYESRNTLKTKK